MNSYITTLDKGVLLPFCAVSLIYISSYLIGHALVHLFGIKWREQISGAVIETVLGLNILSLLILISGSCGMLTTPTIIWSFLTISSAVPFLFGCRGMQKNIFRFCLKNRSFLILLSISACFLLGSALLIPYSWDEQTYQIAVPFRWIHSGGFPVFADNPYSAFPALPQIIFRLGCQIAGLRFPRIFCYTTYMIAFLTVFLILRKSLSRSISTALICIFIFSPLVLDTLKETYSEVFILLNLSASILLFRLIRRDSKQKNEALIAGIMAGGAVAVKLTGLGVLLIILIAVIFFSRQKRLKPLLTQAVFPFLISASLFASLFFIRPYIYTGNPVYPFFHNCFSSAPGAYELAQFHHMMGSRFGTHTITGFFLLPFYAAYRGDLFDAVFAGYQLIALLILSGLWIIHSRSSLKNHWWLIISPALYYIFWFSTAQQSRFLLPFLLLLLLTTARFLSTVKSHHRNLFLTLLLIISASTFIYPRSNISKIRHFYVSWKMVFSDPSPVELLDTALGKEKVYIKILEDINSMTPPAAKIMLIFERRGLYVPRNYVIGTPRFQTRFFMPLPENSNELYNSLKKNKIDYIVIANRGIGPDFLPENSKLNFAFSEMIVQCLIKKQLYLQKTEEIYSLLRVAKSPE